MSSPAEHNHRGPDPCPVCGYDSTFAVPLHPTEVRKGREGVAKARAAMRKEDG